MKLKELIVFKEENILKNRNINVAIIIYKNI